MIKCVTAPPVWTNCRWMKAISCSAWIFFSFKLRRSAMPSCPMGKRNDWLSSRSASAMPSALLNRWGRFTPCLMAMGKKCAVFWKHWRRSLPNLTPRLSTLRSLGDTVKSSAMPTICWRSLAAVPAIRWRTLILTHASWMPSNLAWILSISLRRNMAILLQRFWNTSRGSVKNINRWSLVMN